MKKKLLLFIASFVCVVAVNAQQKNNESLAFTANKTETLKPAYHEPMRDLNAATQFSGRKGTATGGSKWYQPFHMIDQAYVGGTLTTNTAVMYVDWDSTLLQKFNNVTTNNGYAPVNWVGAAQFVDPIYSIGFNSVNTATSGSDITVLGGAPYTVDSIVFPGGYMKGISGGSQSTIDTLYLSVAPVTYDSLHGYTTADTPSAPYAKVINYDDVSAHGGVLKVMRLGPADSLHRQLGNAGVIKWKVPLDTTLRKPRDPSTGAFPIHLYTFAVPGGLNVPAGNGFAVSVAFKPGEPWVAGDSVAKHHYFMLEYAQAQVGARAPYFFYTFNDRNMSYLMHYAGTNRYGDAIRIEMFNQDDYAFEFIDIGAHVVCNTCWDLSAAGANKNLLTAKAYPNPATDEINIPFTLMSPAKVTVTLVNMMGATVASQSVENLTSAKIVFSTLNLNDGVYFYNVEANGERKTGKVVVAH